MIHNEVMFIDPDAREGQNPALFRKYIANYLIFCSINHMHLQAVWETTLSAMSITVVWKHSQKSMKMANHSCWYLLSTDSHLVVTSKWTNFCWSFGILGCYSWHWKQACPGIKLHINIHVCIITLQMIIYSLQEGFSYLLETREEKLFINMQYRLQQASINDRERRILLSQLESRAEAQKALVIIIILSW